MNWSPAVTVAWTVAFAVVIVGLIWLVARLRLRGMTVAIVGVVLCGGAAAYLWLRTNEPGESTVGQSPAAPRSQQTAGQSSAGRNTPGLDKPEGRRSREIVQTEKPSSISDAQLQQVREYVAKTKPKRVDHVDFSLVIGSDVPRNVGLDDLPTKISDALNGYGGDQYLLVRDQMVIVDAASRRIVALIPGVA